MGWEQGMNGAFFEEDYVYEPNPFYDGHVNNRMRRASGDCVCDTCGREYRRHPREPHEAGPEHEPYLERLCDGSLVKL